ncbi:MAG: hypothetical protein K9W45_08715 [Candidatus Heimdallarchaeum aukensis]|uniref:Uncharacterized protein n=1 Tax=Candidatus Heimdallarchaeum aukensis TaxID=2876573 RepID=A0A9Y1FK28_9ARCH|nr:MAG: hypothetical protein K9W45_08715 [Candidatus Heimdallarchaeum aukensis]
MPTIRKCAICGCSSNHHLIMGEDGKYYCLPHYVVQYLNHKPDNTKTRINFSL